MDKNQVTGTRSEREWRWVGLLAIALAVVGSTAIAASSWVRVKTRTVRTIEVTGSAKRRIASDLIIWRASVTTQDGERTTAYRKLRDDVNKTLVYLKGQGVKDDEIRVSSVTTSQLVDTEVVGSGDDRVERQVAKGFQTTQEIQVSSGDVQKIERVSREVTALIEQGVSIVSEAPAYLYTKLGELKIEMLAEASKDARLRAVRIIESAGAAHVGKLRSADMGVINVNPANSTATSWDGNNDTTALDKDIITIVHCSFDID